MTESAAHKLADQLTRKATKKNLAKRYVVIDTCLWGWIVAERNKI